MRTFIKSNLEARFSSLIEGSHSASLFQTNHLLGQGIYLNSHQEYLSNSPAKATTILTIFKGTGELSILEPDQKPLHIQITSGDILIIPNMTSFKILNTDQDLLIISEILVR